MYETTYLITGAAGFVGSHFVKHLMDTAEYEAGHIYIIAIVRNVQKAKSLFAKNNCSYIKFVVADVVKSNLLDRILALRTIGKKIDYIIHCAANTQSAQMLYHPVETADGIVIGTKNILELAKQCKVKSMVFLSSMEVYGFIPETKLRIREEQLGDINVFSSRSSYPLGKRMAEFYCYAYYKEFDLPVKIARLAQTFGAGVTREDNKVYSQFAKSVINNTDIVIHTSGNSVGNYCEINDVIVALLIILNRGEDGQAYNVVNEANTMKIREMAELVVNDVAHGKIKVVFDNSKENSFGYAYETGLRLSAEKMLELGWKPQKTLKDMYDDMIGEWRK